MAAGLARPETRAVELLDGGGGRLVVRSRLIIGLVVRQIGADHEQGLGPAPEAVERSGHRRGRRVADQERHEGEVAEHGLEERQLDLERVLGLVRHVGRRDLRQVADRSDRIVVDRDVAKRRAEGLGDRQGEAAERHDVRRPDHDDAAQPGGARAERAEGAAGHRPGVDVAGMGRDQRLGRTLAGRALGRGKETLDHGPQATRLCGIERACHRRRADAAHPRPSPVARIWPKAHLMWHARRPD